MVDLIKPIEKEFDLPDDEGKRTFILSKLPAIVGREILSQYIPSAMPQGDYAKNQALMLKMMSFVAVVLEDGRQLRLTTAALIDNHCDPETLMRIEIAMLEYNSAVFRNGKISSFLAALETTAHA